MLFLQNYRCPSTLEKTRKREQKDRKLVFGHYAERQGFRQSQKTQERLKPGRNGFQNANCYGVKRGSYGNLPPRRTVEIRRFLDNLAFFNILCKNKLVHIFFEELNASIPVFHKKFCADCSFFNNLTQAQTEYAIAFNIGAIWNIILKWTSDGMKIPKKKIISGIVKYLDFLHG